MVWAGINTAARTDLVFVEHESLTGHLYVEEILLEHVVPFAPFIGDGFTLMQDNARPHVARIVQQFVDETEIHAIKTEAETSCSDIPKVSESEKMAVTSKNKAVVPRRRSARIPAREKNKCTNLPRRRRQSTTQAQKTRTKLTEICSKDACVAAVKKRGQPPEGSSPKESSLKRKADARIPCKKSARISEKLSRKPIKKEDDVRKLKSLEEGTRQQDGDEDKGSGGLVKGDCVICNNYTDNGTVLDSQTLTSKMHFYQKLIKVTAEENEVMVSEEGVLCSICTRLLNYMDRIEMELAMLKTAIINCLRKKCSTKQKACRTDQDHHDHPGEGNKMVIRHNSTEVKDDVENVSDHRQQTSDVQNPNEPKPVREAHHIILENTNTPSYQDKSIENECEVPSKQYNCTICSFTTMYKSMIIFHLRQHVKDSFRCDFCNITISENFERPLKMSTLRHLRYKRAALPLPTRVMSTVPLDSAPIPASSGAAILRKKHSKC
ncbi:uncharacterized protein [Anabrus simplex]|uniref:uncharacterized protein n=1 Tax=Anabrus simplex TaxID=316456 RepID=UPI0035A2E411